MNERNESSGLACRPRISDHGGSARQCPGSVADQPGCRLRGAAGRQAGHHHRGPLASSLASPPLAPSVAPPPLAASSLASPSLASPPPLVRSSFNLAD